MENVISIRPSHRDKIPAEVTPDRLLRIKMRMAELKMDQSGLSAATGLSNSAISQIMTMKFKNTRHFPAIARALGVNLPWLLAETDQRVEMGEWKGRPVSDADLPQLLEQTEFAASQVDVVATDHVELEQFNKRSGAITLPEIDLTLTSSRKVNGVPVTIRRHIFGRDVISAYTRATPANVMVATDIGDVMQPALLDGDLLFIDTAQTKPDGADKIWAFSYCGVGMIRRLRVTTKGIRIFSDNPNHPGEVAEADEIQVIGLVAGCVRRL